MLGASDDGSYVYYLDAAGLFLWHDGTGDPVAAGADAGNYPPTTGTARVSADGPTSPSSPSPELTSYRQPGLRRGLPLLAPPAAGEAPRSASPATQRANARSAPRLPGAIANGKGADLPHAYKPRALSADGKRVFFDTTDVLVAPDTNNDLDVYQWEAPGAGTCAQAGRLRRPDLQRPRRRAPPSSTPPPTARRLLPHRRVAGPHRPRRGDVYDARVGGGFPPPESRSPAWRRLPALPPEPEDPTPGTLARRVRQPAAGSGQKAAAMQEGKVRSTASA